MISYKFQTLATSYKEKYPSGNTHVAGYTARPFIRIRPDQNTGYRSLGFVKGVLELYKELNMTGEEFDRAYAAAGTSFNGRLSDLFIILNDNHAAASPAKVWSMSKDLSQIGKSKRSRPDLDDSGDASQNNGKRNPSRREPKRVTKPKAT